MPWVLLVLSAAALQLLSLWLWNPRVNIPPPDVVKVAVADGDELRVLFAGDTAPGDAALPVFARHGFSYAYEATRKIVSGADLAIANLETAISSKHTPFPLYKRWVYRAPPTALSSLSFAGFNAVTLANNHIMDHGVRGLRDTVAHVRRTGLTPIGAGDDVQAARRGAIFALASPNGTVTRVAVLSYLEDSPMHSLYMRSFTQGHRPGCARLELTQLRRDVARARAHADVVIVSPHWGRNYTGVTTVQRYYARRAIDAGADAVIGHHPHIHHPVARYRGKPIVYSLGNYAFGTSGQTWFRYGLLAQLRLRNKRITAVELIPLMVQNRIVKFQPRPLTPDEAKAMLRKLKKSSAAHGATLKLVGNRALLKLSTS